MDAAPGKYGLKNANGKLVVKTIYAGFKDFHKGMIAVNTGGQPNYNFMTVYNGQQRFIDSTGKKVIDVVYNQVGDFSNGLVTVKKNGKWGYTKIE